MTFIAADVNELALSIFGVVVAVTLIVTYFASKRVTSATGGSVAAGVLARRAARAVVCDCCAAAHEPERRNRAAPQPLSSSALRMGEPTTGPTPSTSSTSTPISSTGSMMSE